MYNLSGEYFKVNVKLVNILNNFKHKTYIKITKNEYMKATGDTPYIINRLKNSKYPYQKNDYFLVENIPIDWRLKPLIKFFWKNDLTILSSHDGGKYIQILFKNYKKTLIFLKKFFGEENIDIRNDKILILKHRHKDLNIEFSEEMLLHIYKKYNLKIPEHSKAHKGGRITNESTKNIRDNYIRIERLVKDVKNEKLKENLKNLFLNKIENFKWKEDEDFFHSNDLVNYKNNLVSLNLDYLQ